MRTLNDEMLRPFYLPRPRVFLDGNSWCALYGENIQEGICAFGDTPAEAAELFDVAFYGGLRNGKEGPRRTVVLVPEGKPEKRIREQKRVGWWVIPVPPITPEGEPLSSRRDTD